ncbi:alkaline phosphatase [Candidatus Colwellia aromaticivorans]|uniref:alkaline phosphatase n=1 Tax=Candidatus Colwellia aromaticivorans TaxID=2267621 RepID=UPI000DF451F1|nr:alkaline phosphatase [Candidatus Colwellia aromaticivorans]
MRHFLPLLLLFLSTASCVSTATPKKETTPKNIIMVIGDGMGPAYTTAYRYFSDNPNTNDIEKTVFDRHFVGSSSTYPARVSGYITDSAASATALATGVKTYNNAVGVDVNKKELQTVLEWAKLQGKKTGVVVTSQINHATPASYLAHNEHRYNYNKIADSYIDDGIKADLYLGGGWKYFIRDDRNLVNEFKQAGFHYIDSYDGLNYLPSQKPVLGLFAKVGLPWALDDVNNHKLMTMTKAAVTKLENTQGFFLLVEGSKIDWAGHSNDIAAAMGEMDDLAKTVEYLETYVSTHPDTLVVMTADHSTGGLALGKITGYSGKEVKSKYLWHPQVIRKMNMSPEAISKKIAVEVLSIDEISTLLTFDITPEEYTLLANAKLEGKTAATSYNQIQPSAHKLKYPTKINSMLLKSIKKIIDKRTNTGWGSISASASHNPVDVQVFSFGAKSEIFRGFQDNTDIAKKIFTLLGK